MLITGPRISAATMVPIADTPFDELHLQPVING
jgi:hypothetical protein